MYIKSIIVVILCTAFVIGFALVINYEASSVGTLTGGEITTTEATCTAAPGECESMVIGSASLRTVNYTDELGPVGYADLAFVLNVSGSVPVSSISVYLANASAGTIGGPFQPGGDKLVNFTLPATAIVSQGTKYVLQVEGFYGEDHDVVWATAEVTAS